MVKTNTKYSETGQSLVVFSVLITVLLSMMALALDLGVIWFTRRQAQSSADSAAFAGAQAYIREGDWNTAALDSAAQNGFIHNEDGDTVINVNIPPSTGQHERDDNYIQVTINTSIPSFFSRVFLGDNWRTTIESVVYIDRDPTFSISPHAMIAQSPDDCETLGINGNLYISIKGGNTFTNSSMKNSEDGCHAMLKRGSSGVMNVQNGKVLVVGSFDYRGNDAYVSPFPEVGLPQETIPQVPVPDCTLLSNFSSDPSYNIAKGSVNGSADLTPGVYDSITITDTNSKIHFAPGLYCINGDFKATGGFVEGTDVLFVMNGGSYNLGGNTKIYLQTSQTPFELGATNGELVNYQGMLVFADPTKYPTHDVAFTMNGSSETKYLGTIYAPGTPCTFNGGISSSLFKSQIICHTVNIGGNGFLSITYNKGDNFLLHGKAAISLAH